MLVPFPSYSHREDSDYYHLYCYYNLVKYKVHADSNRNLFTHVKLEEGKEPTEQQMIDEWKHFRDLNTDTLIPSLYNTIRFNYLGA